MSRDYTLGDTVYIAFTTRAFATGIPTVLAGTPVVSAYENASLTQITAGITLTVSIDSVVGLNMLTIVATSGNGFELGKDYHFVITTGTVSSVSVIGEVVGHFSLGRSAAAADLANGTDGLGALKTLIDTVDNFLDTEIAAILVDTSTTLQAELDAIQAAVITNAAGVDIAADIIAIKAETAAIVNDTDLIDDGTSGLAKIATDVAAILNDTDLIDDGTSGLAKIATDVAAILVDTGTTLDTKINTIDDFLDTEIAAITAAVITNAAGADVAADIIAVKAETALIVGDTNELQVDDVPGLIAALNDVSAANVATEISDALTVDTIAELSQGIPATTPTFATALMLMYMALRNDLKVTETEQGIHNNAGTKIVKSTLSDDGTTFTNAKMGSGA